MNIDFPLNPDCGEINCGREQGGMLVVFKVLVMIFSGATASTFCNVTFLVGNEKIYANKGILAGR